jgi:DNA-binding transcriptional regulator YhcF (GntR family)
VIPEDRRSGYVRRWRCLYDSPIYRHPAAWRVYDYVEAHANWRVKTWINGIVVQPGQYVTSRERLAAKTGLTVQVVRNALSILERHQVITLKATKTYTIITITNWTDEQINDGQEEPTQQPTEKPTEEPTVNPVSTRSQPQLKKVNSNTSNQNPSETQIAHRSAKSSAPASSVRSGREEAEPQLTEYPLVRRVLWEYLSMMGKKKNVSYPSDRTVVDVVHAARGASEKEIAKVLQYFYHGRGLRPDVVGGPDHYAWFRVVLENYYEEKEQRHDSSHPLDFYDWEERNETKAARMRADPPPSDIGTRGIIEVHDDDE